MHIYIYSDPTVVFHGKSKFHSFFCCNANTNCSVRSSSHYTFVRKAPTTDSLFQKRQQAPNWTSSMNTQDQHQTMLVPVHDGGDTNMEILDEAVCDVSAPTTGSIH